MVTLMRCGIVGCGYAADFYMANLDNHPRIDLIGAYDQRPERLSAFVRRHGIRPYSSLEEMLEDTSMEIVLNLTNPSSHFEISRRFLAAGRHVYSEKPLALTLDHGQELVRIARDAGVQIAAAPCSLLGESAQTA